jgi:hypothetical protein
LYKLALFKEKIHENGLTQDALAAIAAIFWDSLLFYVKGGSIKKV